jgi:hypothetical protein
LSAATASTIIGLSDWSWLSQPTVDQNQRLLDVGDARVEPGDDGLQVDHQRALGIGARELRRFEERDGPSSRFNQHVYAEVRAGGNPIALISGRDVVEALRGASYGDHPSIQAWLRQFV